MKRFLGLLLAFALVLGAVPQAFAEGNAYTVEEVYFSDLQGTVMENPATSCVVNVKVKKQAERLSEDTVVIASYATDGTMIGFTTLSGSLKKGETGQFSTLVKTASDKNIGIVKAYVWDSVLGMKPLSEVKQVEVNQMDEGIELPTVNDEIKTGERYIPDTVQVTGTITESYKTRSGYDKGEFFVRDMTLVTDYRNLASAEEYQAYVDRTNAIKDYYNVWGTQGVYYSDNDVLSSLNLEDYLYRTGKFTITKNEKGKLVVLGFEPTDADEIAEFDAEDYRMQADLSTDDKFSNSGRVYFGTKSYKFKDNGSPMGAEIELYINGVPMAVVGTYGNNDDLIDKYLGVAHGKVRILDLSDGDYVIFAESYNTGEVLSVVSKNGETTIYTQTKEAVEQVDKIVLEDGETEVSVIRNGEKATLADLKIGDIISYTTDFGCVGYANHLLSDASFLNIIATDKKATGLLSEIKYDNDDRIIYKVGGKEYYALEDLSLCVGDNYSLSLDTFGRIFSAEAVSAKKYAIIEKYSQTDNIVTMFLADGTIRKYELSSNVTICDENGENIDLYGANSLIYGSDGVTKNDIGGRIVEYNIRNSSGEITRLSKVGTISVEAAEYKARSQKLGRYFIDENTVIVDATDYSETSSGAENYAVISESYLTDGTEYNGYVCRNGSKTTFIVITGTSNKEPVVVPTEDNSEINGNTGFAVFRRYSGYSIWDDGENISCYEVLDNGEETTLYVPYIPNCELECGDAFIYTTDEDGLVENIYAVFDFSLMNAVDFKTAGVPEDKYDGKRWNFNLYDDGSQYQLVLAVVADIDGNEVTLAPVPEDGCAIDINCDVASAESNLGGNVYTLAENVCVYEYDTEDGSANREYRKIRTANAVSASQFELFEIEDGVFVYSSNGIYREEFTNYAVALINSGKIVEIYVIK